MFRCAFLATTLALLCGGTAYPGQLGRVEVSEFLNGTGPILATSTAEGDFNLSVGATLLEASMNTSQLSVLAAPQVGVAGTLFATANSIDTPMSFANALYEFEFSLPFGAEELFLLYLPVSGPPNGGFPIGHEAGGSLRLIRNGTDLFSATNEFLEINGGILQPGDYRLEVEMAASASASGPAESGTAGGQVQFGFNFVPVPEPTGLAFSLFCALQFLVLCRRAV